MSAPLLVLLALQAPLDEGTLLVRQDTAEIGREAFRLSAAPGGVGGAGWTLASTVRYDRTRPIVVLNPILQVGPDSAPASLEYTVADPREPLRILGQLARGRFTVRLLGRRTARAGVPGRWAGGGARRLGVCPVPFCRMAGRSGGDARYRDLPPRRAPRAARGSRPWRRGHDPEPRRGVAAPRERDR